jgi:glycosyltransferase involved in cell wall biosynthesis
MPEAIARGRDHCLADVQASEPSNLPLVSCIMPTFELSWFVERAIRYFRNQDFPRRELLIVDDGSAPIAGIVPADDCIHYIRLADRATIGAKRNLGCKAAAGEIFLQWDDDDWYGPSRIRRQATPIILSQADVTGSVRCLMLDLRLSNFWQNAGETPGRARLGSPVYAGSLAYRREIWSLVHGYVDSSLGEDSRFLYDAVNAGARVKAVANAGDYVYIRHGGNTWPFDFDALHGPPGWIQIPSPPFIPMDDLAEYRAFRGGNV